MLPPLGNKSFSPFVTKYDYGNKAKDLKEGFNLAHKVIDEGITKGFVYSLTHG